MTDNRKPKIAPRQRSKPVARPKRLAGFPAPVNTGEIQAGPLAQHQGNPLGHIPGPVRTLREIGRDPKHVVIARDGLETKEESDARMMMSCAVTATHLTRAYSQGLAPGTTDATMSLDLMTQKIAAVNAGDLSEVEAMLISGAVALQAISNEFLRRAANSMGTSLEATETFARMGFKAQAQSRANLEALAEIKNPRPVFAKQTNIANGPQQVNNANQQQVNNGVKQNRAEETETPANKLLVQS